MITGVEGADGEIDGAIVTLDSLAPGESATIHCEYTVLKEVPGSTITNAAIRMMKEKAMAKTLLHRMYRQK